MRIITNSADVKLHKLCREILAQFLVTDIEIFSQEKADAQCADDICIWDYSAGLTLPDFSQLDRCGNYLFLVERKSAAALLAKLPPVPVGLILKPVTRANLAAHLEQSCLRSTAADAAAVNPPSPGKDDVLQHLLHANLRLQEYDHDRTNFLARAMHDFRAPLTALNGYCGLLLEGLLGPLQPEQKEVIHRMAQSGKRLARMSSSLFTLSLARRVGRPVQLQEYSIEDCVQQAIHELSAVTTEKGISISVALHPVACPLFFEPTQFEQLLINLLENACRFTPRRGSIEISGYPFFWERRSRRAANGSIERRATVSSEPNVYRIDISDSGPAIPEGFLPLLFEEYTSYSGPDDRSGGGLGLAICRTIAESHQGGIWVSSGEDGVTFSFVFPLHVPDRSEAISDVRLLQGSAPRQRLAQ
jgi:signal transduction histidine kinase